MEDSDRFWTAGAEVPRQTAGSTHTNPSHRPLHAGDGAVGATLTFYSSLSVICFGFLVANVYLY